MDPWAVGGHHLGGATTYLLMLLTLFFIGAGRWLSLDYWLARVFRRLAWQPGREARPAAA